MNPQTFIFIGNSGCGKGTQTEFLKKYLTEKDENKFPVLHLETGALFREFIKGNSYSEQLSRDIYATAMPQPDFLAVWSVSYFLIKNLTGKEHLITDGMSRSLIEAECIDTALDFYGRKTNVIFLNVSREWSRKHLTARGRSDDTAEGIENRLNWFETDVVPAIEYYRNNPKYNFVEVNGEQGKERVHEDIVSKLILF